MLGSQADRGAIAPVLPLRRKTGGDSGRIGAGETQFEVRGGGDQRR